MVVACIGLAVALSGTGYAVTVLPRNSVGTVQLKKNAVVSSKVLNRSLKAVDFAAGQLPAGQQGTFTNNQWFSLEGISFRCSPSGSDGCP